MGHCGKKRIELSKTVKSINQYLFEKPQSYNYANLNVSVVMLDDIQAIPHVEINDNRFRQREKDD